MLSENKKKTGQTNTKHYGKKLQNKALLLQKYERIYVHVNNKKSIAAIALGNYQQTKVLPR